MRAAVAGSEPRTVIIGCYGDGDDLVLTVSDSGQGVSVGDDLFRRRERPGSAADDAPVHGLGVGLPLSRELARRRGGDVWLIEAGGADTEGPGSGAVFGARLCGVLAPPTTGRDDAP